MINYFEDGTTVIKTLCEHDLIEKNPLSGKYYLSDIFTCNNFLSKYLIEEEKKTQKDMAKKYTYQIKKQELIDFISKLKDFEENIQKIEIISVDDMFEIDLKVEIDDESVLKFKNL